MKSLTSIDEILHNQKEIRETAQAFFEEKSIFPLNIEGLYGSLFSYFTAEVCRSNHLKSVLAAQYSASSGWNITYDADIPEGTNQTCEVRFFVNTNFAYDSFVSMNPETEVYEDVSAKFSFASDVISVTANLTPKSGRIRFTGNSGDNIYLTGISTFTKPVRSKPQVTRS